MNAHWLSKQDHKSIDTESIEEKSPYDFGCLRYLLNFSFHIFKRFTTQGDFANHPIHMR